MKIVYVHTLRVILFFYFILFGIVPNYTNAQCFKKVTTGNLHALAIKTNGTLWAWGINNNGQLGIGTNIGTQTPMQVGADSNWTNVSVGSNHTVALKNNGTLWVWGRNDKGQLGDGTNIDKSSPVQIGTANNWKNISAGNSYTIAIKTDGTLWAWGKNDMGQLGDGTNTDKNTPAQIGIANNWSTVSASESGAKNLAIKTDGTLWTWGYVYDGNGNIGLRVIPTQIGNSNDWASVDYSSNPKALKTDGTLWIWGDNGWGQIGASGAPMYVYYPMPVGNGLNYTHWISVSDGNYHSVAIKPNGTLWACGSNSYGQLGDGTTIDKKYTYVQIGTDSNWATISSKNSQNLAIKIDGSLWGWGWGYGGALGPIGNTSKVPIAIACPYPLPLVLTTFIANKVNQAIVLNWVTASESGSKLFEVEKSNDNKNYLSIANVIARGADGKYSFTDEKPFNNINYYRLKMVDEDGRFTYSKTVMLSLKQNNKLSFSFAPNPATSSVSVSLSTLPNSNAKIIITDLLGSQVKLQQMDLRTITNTIDISNLTKGIYLITLITDKGKETQKLVIE